MRWFDLDWVFRVVILLGALYFLIHLIVFIGR
jgi:hypothetical protein